MVITRLENGANSHNPYWINSSKKLDRILICLAEAIEDGKNVDALLSDKNSELSRAIDMRRIPSLFFATEPTQSREIVAPPQPSNPKI